MFIINAENSLSGIYTNVSQCVGQGPPKRLQDIFKELLENKTGIRKKKFITL